MSKEEEDRLSKFSDIEQAAIRRQAALEVQKFEAEASLWGHRMPTLSIPTVLVSPTGERITLYCGKADPMPAAHYNDHLHAVAHRAEKDPNYLKKIVKEAAEAAYRNYQDPELRQLNKSVSDVLGLQYEPPALPIYLQSETKKDRLKNDNGVDFKPETGLTAADEARILKKIAQERAGRNP